MIPGALYSLVGALHSTQSVVYKPDHSSQLHALRNVAGSKAQVVTWTSLIYEALMSRAPLQPGKPRSFLEDASEGFNVNRVSLQIVVLPVFIVILICLSGLLRVSEDRLH